MKVYDLHGYRLSEAIELFNKLLDESRMVGQESMRGEDRQIRFITGHGEIRQALVALCHAYDLDCFDYDHGNLVITFE